MVADKGLRRWPESSLVVDGGGSEQRNHGSYQIVARLHDFEGESGVLILY